MDRRTVVADRFSLIPFSARGVAYRLRAVLLLFVFAIGSIIARDAALIQRIAAGNIPSVPELRQEGPKSKLKVRPSGFSRRTAWCPTDPPDDDDELDDDSDTLPCRALPATGPALPGGPVEIARVELSNPRQRTALFDDRIPARQRGPPA